MEAHGPFSTLARWIGRQLAALFLFDEFAQALTRVLAHGFKLGVGAITFGKIVAVFLAQCANACVAPLFADLTVLVALSSVETFAHSCPMVDCWWNLCDAAGLVREACASNRTRVLALEFRASVRKSVQSLFILSGTPLLEHF